MLIKLFFEKAQKEFHSEVNYCEVLAYTLPSLNKIIRQMKTRPLALLVLHYVFKYCYTGFAPAIGWRTLEKIIRLVNVGTVKSRDGFSQQSVHGFITILEVKRYSNIIGTMYRKCFGGTFLVMSPVKVYRELVKIKADDFQGRFQHI